MPDLPNMGYERDILGFKSFSLLHLTPRELFENPVFRPDGLKLYPTLVIRGTGLYELWKKGQCLKYTTNLRLVCGVMDSMLVVLTPRALSLVPPWMRVYRIQVREPTRSQNRGISQCRL